MLIQYHWNSKFFLRGVVAKNVAMSDQGLLIKACIVSDNPPEKKTWNSALWVAISNKRCCDFAHEWTNSENQHARCI